MFTGWWKPLRFRVDRVLTEDERKVALSRQEVMSDDFSAHGSLVALNSTYIEWIDRRFMARGSINTSLTLLGSVGIFVAASYLLLYKGMLEVDLDAKLVAIFGFVLISLFSVFLYYAQPRYDFLRKFIIQLDLIEKTAWYMCIEINRMAVF